MENKKELREFVFLGTSHLSHLQNELNQELFRQPWFMENFHYPPTHLSRRGGKFSKKFIDKYRKFLARNERKLTIFLNMGSNDLRFARSEKESEKKRVSEVYYYIQNIHHLTERAGDATLILSGLIPDTTHYDVYKYDFGDLTGSLRAYAKLHGVLYFDTYKYIMLFNRPNLDLFRDLPKDQMGQNAKVWGPSWGDHIVGPEGGVLPISYQKGIHMNELGNNYMARMIVRFLTFNYQMKDDPKILPEIKYLKSSLGEDLELEAYLHRDTDKPFEWPNGCEWCNLVVFRCDLEDLEDKSKSLVLDLTSIMPVTKCIWEFEAQMKKLELYELAVQADSYGMLKKFGVSMPHIAEKIQSYVISEDVRAVLANYKYVDCFKRQVRVWAKNDLYFRVIEEHIRNGLEEHLQYLEVYPRFHLVHQHFKWEHLTDLMEHYPQINALVRDLDAEWPDN